jgi:VanZ family protein
MLGMQASTSANRLSQTKSASLTLEHYDEHKAARSEFVSLLMSTMRFASIVLLGYWALIFIGTHLPSARMPHLHASDKLYHFVAFAGLSFLLCWAIPSSRVSWGKILLFAALIATTYAVLDELTQQFIPGRSCDIWDVCADTVGVVLGLIAYSIARLIVGRMKWAQRILAPNT